MSKQCAIVVIYKSHTDAEDVVKKLQKTGVDMKSISIVGKDYHTEENVVGYYNAGDRMKYWGKFGAFWGGLWGLLFGSAFFWIPGIGTLLVAGPLASAILGALEGAVFYAGISVLGAGLFSLGIPKNSIIKYETFIKCDKFLVFFHGTEEDVAIAKEVFKTTEVVQCDHYDDLHNHTEKSTCCV